MTEINKTPVGPVSVEWLQYRLENATFIASCHEADSGSEEHVRLAMTLKEKAANFRASGDGERADLCNQIAEKWIEIASSH